MWERYENNPCGKITGDCVIRAISKALGREWYDVYIDLTIEGLSQCDWGNNNAVWDAYLRKNGYNRHLITNDCEGCYTFEDFANEHPKGTYILATGAHLATIIDGTLYDSWNSLRESPILYYQRES